MARQLWLLRHGDAEPQDERPDAERRLTERGRAQARSAGLALAALEVRIELAFTSPKARAVETAGLACEPLGVEPVPHRALAGGFDAGAARELLGAGDDDQCVLVVGHEPDFSQVVHDLTGGRVDFKKGGLAAVRVDGARGELVALLRPRELDRIR
jgi:phosphohistidine phosphatase